MVSSYLDKPELTHLAYRQATQREERLRKRKYRKLDTSTVKPGREVVGAK
jgi:hypothetical protein